MSGPGRLRRLQNDWDEMQAIDQQNGLIYVIDSAGDPPEHYLVGFRCRGVAEIDAQDQPVLRDQHRVELLLTPQYPRIRPIMYWLTPIYHPNFDGQGGVCIEKWYSQQTVAELCVALAEMVQYKNYNTTSPLNLDAAMWAMRHRNELPIDDRNLFAQTQEAPPQEPVSRSVYQASIVVTGTIPIWTPPGEESSEEEPTPVAASDTTQEHPPTPEPRPVPQPALEQDLAPFCQRCGNRFQDTESRFCPRCGAERAVL